jgi:hypothetical protein
MPIMGSILRGLQSNGHLPTIRVTGAVNVAKKVSLRKPNIRKINYWENPFHHTQNTTRGTPSALNIMPL